MLERAGVTRGDAIVIMESFVIDSRYGTTIAMMDSDNSPSEIRDAVRRMKDTYGIKAPPPRKPE